MSGRPRSGMTGRV
jgi:hypothetical protein